MWSAGQLRVNWLPLTTAVIGGGVIFMAATRRVPSVVRCVVSHFSPLPGDSGLIAANAPEAEAKLKS